MTENPASYNSFSPPLRFIAIVTRSISNLKAKEPSCYSHRFPFANSFLVTSYVISRRTVLLRFLARPFSRVSRYNRFFGKRKLKRVGLFDRLIQNRFVRLNDRMNNSVPRNVRVSQPWNERNSSNVIKHLLLPFFFLFFFFSLIGSRSIERGASLKKKRYRWVESTEKRTQSVKSASFMQISW